VITVVEYLFFKEDMYEVGAEIQGFCANCKTNTPHTILTMFEGEVRSVQCNICNSSHAFRPARGDVEDDVVYEPLSVRRRLTKRKLSWQQATEGLDPKSIPPYMGARRYTEGDLIRHDIFGVGYVSEEVSDTTIEATFDNAKKLLGHNRPGLTPDGVDLASLAPVPKVAGSEPPARATKTRSRKSKSKRAKPKRQPVVDEMDLASIDDDSFEIDGGEMSFDADTGEFDKDSSSATSKAKAKPARAEPESRAEPEAKEEMPADQKAAAAKKTAAKKTPAKKTAAKKTAAKKTPAKKTAAKKTAAKKTAAKKTRREKDASEKDRREKDRREKDRREKDRREKDRSEKDRREKDRREKDRRAKSREKGSYQEKGAPNDRQEIRGCEV
jgi:hypothetical protein